LRIKRIKRNLSEKNPENTFEKNKKKEKMGSLQKALNFIFRKKIC